MPMIFIFWGFCIGSGQQNQWKICGDLRESSVEQSDPLDERWGVALLILSTRKLTAIQRIVEHFHPLTVVFR